MEDFGAAAQRFAEGLGANGHNHKFLDVQAVVGVFAAIDHVHHRHRHRHRTGAAQIAVERQAGVFGGGAGNGQRYRQRGVGAETAFVVGAVQIKQDAVDIALLGSVDADQRLGDFVIDVFNGFEHAFAQIAGGVAVAQFQRFARAGGSAAGYGGATHHAAFQQHVAFYGGIAARIEDFTGENVGNGTHR